MTEHVLLDNIRHKDLKVITRRAAEFGDNLNAVMTFPTEYADIQREYPIFFRKIQNTNDYQSIALLGLVEGENLFLDDQGWHASYVPAVVSKGPFLIGFQNQEIEGEVRKDAVIHIDMEDPRVNESEGEAVFLEHGGNSPYLEKIADTLHAIHRGMAYSKAMFAAFEANDLLEPVDIEIEVHPDQKINLRGFYTINEEQLRNLSGEALEKLNKAGFLQGAYLMLASHTNVKKLIEMKRRRILQQRPNSTK